MELEVAEDCFGNSETGFCFGKSTVSQPQPQNQNQRELIRRQSLLYKRDCVCLPFILEQRTYWDGDIGYFFGAKCSKAADKTIRVSVVFIFNNKSLSNNDSFVET